MKSQSKFDNLIHWIRGQISLRRAWYLYTICLILFVILSIVYPDTFRLTLGISVLTIAMMYLIMMSSNIELQRATQTQVKAFVEQLQTLGNELKKVSHGINALTHVMKEVQRTILENTLVSKRAVAITEAEKKKRKESIRPQLSIMVKMKGFQFLIFDNRHYHLLVWNSGSDAIGTVVRIGDFVSEAYNIGIRKQIDIDIGHINNFKGIPQLGVHVELRDVDRNRYQGNVQVSLLQPQRISVSLTEM